jgi:hypothetical protein
METEIENYISNVGKLYNMALMLAIGKSNMDIKQISVDIEKWPEKEQIILQNYRKKKSKSLLKEPIASYRHYLEDISNNKVTDLIKTLQHEMFIDYRNSFQKDFHEYVEKYLNRDYNELCYNYLRKYYSEHCDEYIDDINSFKSKWKSIIYSLVEVEYCLKKVDEKYKLLKTDSGEIKKLNGVNEKISENINSKNISKTACETIVFNNVKEVISKNIETDATDETNCEITHNDIEIQTKIIESCNNIEKISESELLINNLPRKDYQIVKTLLLRMGFINNQNKCINKKAGYIKIIYYICKKYKLLSTIGIGKFTEYAFNEFGINKKRNNVTHLIDYDNLCISIEEELTVIVKEQNQNIYSVNLPTFSDDTDSI